jgi:hypothetical protein
MSLAPALVLCDGDRQRLAELARLPSVPSGLAKRARIVLLAADGISNAQIARTAGGKITADACYPRHRHQEFLRFLKKVAAAHPAVELHIVADNYAAHKHPAVKAWLNRRLQRPLHPVRLDQRRRRATRQDQAVKEVTQPAGARLYAERRARR